MDDELTLRARRESFLIDPQGKVARHSTGVAANTHAAGVLKDFGTLLPDSPELA